LIEPAAEEVSIYLDENLLGFEECDMDENELAILHGHRDWNDIQ